MPIRIESAALKTATKLTSRVKDVEDLGDRVPYWSTVHRLIASPEKLRLLTTDRDVFLDWSIPLSGTGGDEFDVLVPAAQLNSVARHGLDGALLEIRNDPEILTLRQGKGVSLARNSQIHGSEGQRTLRIRTEEVDDPYPPTPRHTGTKWTTQAQPLARALAFMAAHGWDVRDEEAGLDRRVTSWLPGGQMLAGNSTMGSFVTGLDSPPISVNLRNDRAEVLLAFLQILGGTVEIDLAETVASFRCTTAGHTLVVPVEQVEFPKRFKDTVSWDYEVARTDLMTLLDSLETLGALVPPGEDHLGLRLSGDQDSSIIHLSTPTEAEFQSSDELSAVGRKQVRLTAEGGASGADRLESEGPFEDTVFRVPWESLCYALRSLKAVTVELRYLPDPRGRGPQYLRVYAVGKDPHEPERSVILKVRSGTMGNPRPVLNQESPLVPYSPAEAESPTPPDAVEVGSGDVQSAGDLTPDTDLPAEGDPPSPITDDHEPGQDVPPTPAIPQQNSPLIQASLNGTGGRPRGTRQR